MGKFTEDSRQLLKFIGGKENIEAVSHCITRVRFVLRDASKANIEEIEKIPSVRGTFTQAGQFQVIIGNAVADFYNDFVAVAGVDGVSKEAVKEAAKDNQNPLQKLLTSIAEIFAPLIPAIIVGGLILGFRNVIDAMLLFDNGSKTLTDISQFWSGIDSFLWLIGQSIFHIGIPVGICWSVTKKMGTTEMLGIVLGLTLVSPQLLSAYDVATTAAADIPYWDFGFAHVNMIGYQAQVIPAILAAFTLVYLERFLRKITPQSISMIIVPFFSLVFSVMAAHFVLGPIGWRIGSAISAVIYAGVTGSFRVVFGAIFGFFYAPLVITGLHHMSNAIDLQLIADFNGTQLWPMIALSNIAQGSAVLGMVLLQRRNEEAQEVNVPAVISCYLGVTEPAIFGVNLKYVFPFFCGMVGSCVAAVMATAMGVTANAIGVGGLPGILSIQPRYWGAFVICMLVAIVIPLILVMLVGRMKLSPEQRGLHEVSASLKTAASASESETESAKNSKATDTNIFLAPASGKAIPLASLDDGVFSEGIMGEGMAIEPTGDRVLAPAKGKVTVMMPESKHAIGLLLDNGAEVLIHIGLDTVNMKGEGFSYLVEDGAEVAAGQELIAFDREAIHRAGYRDSIAVVLTDLPQGLSLSLRDEGQLIAGQTTLNQEA